MISSENIAAILKSLPSQNGACTITGPTSEPQQFFRVRAWEIPLDRLSRNRTVFPEQYLP
jgi:hypothetical protein